jgi:uncharacterized protein YndB with AHSA1/START domain
MKWVLIVLGGLVGLIALAAIIGLFVPKGHVARHEVRLEQPPESVWAVITDFAAQPQWFEMVTSSERVADINGHPAWRENFDGFTADMETAEWDPPRRLRRVVHSQNAGFRGSWTWELAPDGAGTRLVITEAGEVDNPIFRLMSALMDQTATARRYGEALRARLAGRPAARTGS